MTPMLKAPELRAIAEEPERFAAELWRWSPTTMLPQVVDLLRDDEVLLRAVREAADDYRRQQLALWLPRVTDHPDTPTLEAFLALANRCAQQEFPGHPVLTDAILGETRWGSWGARIQRGSEVVDGVGWELVVEVEIHGWANEMEEDLWTATAFRGDARVVVHRSACTGIVSLWSELVLP